MNARQKAKMYKKQLDEFEHPARLVLEMPQEFICASISILKSDYEHITDDDIKNYIAKEIAISPRFINSISINKCDDDVTEEIRFNGHIAIIPRE